MEVDLLIFDLDDTLVDWAQRATVAQQRVAELLARRLPGTVAEWLQVLAERDGDLWDKVVNGEVLQEELATIRIQRAVAKFNGSHTTADVIAEATQIQQRAMLEEARVDRAAHKLLASLRQHYALHLLTNGVASLQWPTIRRLGLEEYFDEILICSELRSYKPHPPLSAKPWREPVVRPIGPA